jgi:hypothetical protein
MTGIVFYALQPKEIILLDPVPPSETPPDNYTTVETIQAGALLLNASANATGMVPHQGPISFYMNLEINVTNTGSEDAHNFTAVKMSVYNADSELFYTFGFAYSPNVTILAGETLTLTYQNRETRIEVTFGPWDIYARVLVTFDTDYVTILTTPLILGMFAIE